MAPELRRTLTRHAQARIQQRGIAQDLLAHLEHEPEALIVTTAPADDAVLGRVLERGGIRLRPEVGTVSYANSCRFRGRTVPHLVVQTDGGPVTVMVLRHERLEAPVRFAEQGFAGTIVPAGPGSIAVIGGSDADLEQITERVLAAVDWERE
jgi:Cft2 family RNA processing exonuclease